MYKVGMTIILLAAGDTCSELSMHSGTVERDYDDYMIHEASRQRTLASTSTVLCALAQVMVLLQCVNA